MKTTHTPNDRILHGVIVLLIAAVLFCILVLAARSGIRETDQKVLSRADHLLTRSERSIDRWDNRRR